jgi:hypothetical protein
MKVVSSVLSPGPSRPAKSVKLPSLFISAWRWMMAGLIFLPATFRAWSADCVPPPSGLVSWWNGEGNADDIAATNNGTLRGGASFASGKVGQAFDFNGVNGYVEIANSSNLNPSASFSIEGWIFPRKDQTSAIMSKWADTPDQLNQRSYGFNAVPNNALQFAISDWAHQWDVSFNSFYTTNNVFSLNTWSHVAAVYDQPAGARRIYVNGVKVAERIDPPITVTNSTARVGIGANLYSDTGSRGYFDGLIDELSFYSTALSTAEIQAIYNAGSAGKCVPQPLNCVPPPLGLVGWWPGQGNAIDIVGTNNGVLEGGVAFVAGEVGQGFSFNGVSSMVTNVMPGLTNIRNSYTMEFWALPTASRASTFEATSGFAGVSGQRYAIFPGVGITGFAGAGVSVGTNGVSVFECASSYMPSVLVYDTPIIGWTHIAVVHQNRQATLYINGVLVRTGLVSGTDSYPSTCLGEMGLGFGYYAGLLDEVSIYSRALSSPEVQAIYNAGSSGKCRSAVCVPPPSGLVSWWPGEDNANDIAATNNGTLRGGASFASGKVGQAFDFNGINGYVEVANSSNLNPAASFSIEGWIFPRQDQTSAIMAKWADTPDTLNQRSYCLDTYPNKTLMFGISDWAHQWDASFETFSTTNNVFGLNEWSHVAAVYDQPAGARRIYVNGVKVAERIDPPITVTNSTARVGIGANLFSDTGSRGYFDGLIDELSFYSVALSTAEIQAIYSAGSAGKCRSAIAPPRPATATATIVNGFVVGAIITDGGWGYTNTPVVRIIGGGGSGAQAVAVVSNGVVIAVNILNPGNGYTNTPVIVIEPPFIPQPTMGIAAMSLLSFTNLALGTNYQLQVFLGNTWSNLGAAFTAASPIFAQYVSGTADPSRYHLATTPLPLQARATAQRVNGFVVGATVTSGGSGYVTNPAVTIVGGGGTNATAVSHVSGGRVTSITITDAGIGYTSTPTIQIAPPPPGFALSPTVLPVMRLDFADLAPYENYQIQFKPDIGGVWENWYGGLFSPTDVTNSQYLFITSGAGFFRLQYVP